MALYPYDEMTETLMLRVYNNLNEKERRQYAAIEAVKLGHGGINYISDLFGITVRTINAGIKELKKTTFAPKNE